MLLRIYLWHHLSATETKELVYKAEDWICPAIQHGATENTLFENARPKNEEQRGLESDRLEDVGRTLNRISGSGK